MIGLGDVLGMQVRSGQPRRFGSAALTSGLPRLADILGISLHVSKVPQPTLAMVRHYRLFGTTDRSVLHEVVSWNGYGARAISSDRTQVGGNHGRRRRWLFAADV
jgi:hypothetical protein